MYRYAINLSPMLTICDCEKNWNKDLGWTEETYTNEVYQCQLVECPYDDAVASDFYIGDNDIYKFDEEKYLKRMEEQEHRKMIEQQYSLFASLQKKFFLDNVDDEVAYSIRYVFDSFNPNGVFYRVGDRFMYEDKFYKVLQNHTSQTDWLPDTAVSLYVEISDPSVEYPEWKQPSGAHDAYMKGDKITFEGNKYTSLIDSNIWSPKDYPSGWEIITE